MKKTVSLLVVITMLTTLFTCISYAAETQEYKEILSTVKERFDIKDEYETFDSQVSNAYGQNIYYFNWSTDSENSKSISVECGADGVVRSYNSYNMKRNYNHTKTFKKYSMDEYKETAKDILKKINPTIADDIVINNVNSYSVWSYSVNFPIMFTKNGIPVESISGNISINSDDLTLEDFSLYQYTNVTYPDNSTFITKEEAQNAYKDKLGMKLVYMIEYDKDKQTAKPMYITSNNYNQYINAVTGDIYEKTRYYDRYMKNMASGCTDAEASKDEFSRIEQAEIDNVDGLLSISDIEKKLKANKIIKLSSIAKTSFYSLVKDQSNNTYMYNIYFSVDGTHSCSYTVDAKTGVINNYYKSEEYDNKEISESAVKKNCMKYAKELCGNLLNEYIAQDSIENNTLLFVRMKNGAEVLGDNISIRVNGKGEITQYSISYTNMDFPALDNIIDKSSAENILFDNATYSVKYIIDYDRADAISSAVAVYDFDNLYSLSVDPFTGEMKKDIMNEDTLIAYNDIDGHYAQDKINKLAEYGIGFKRDEFNPDEYITQKDYLTMLVQAFEELYIYNTTDSDYQIIFDSAKRMNIISDEERNDNAFVTRMQAGVFLIRAIGADKYATLNNIWASPFKDVTNNIGHVCLLYGMGIITGDENNNFNPNDNLTNADSAIILYNSLVSK